MAFSPCTICFNTFNEETNVPKVLECGHSFCVKCLHTMLQDQKICPKCRSSLSKSVDEYPTNFDLLSMMKNSDGHNSPDLSGYNWREGIKRELLAKKENLMMLMEKRDSLTNSISGEVISTEKLLNTIKTVSEEDYVIEAEEYLETVNASLNCSCNPKLKDLLLLDNYKNVKHFLFDIAVRLQNDEKLFAYKKIGDTGAWKFGRLSFSEDRLHIHNLSESEIEKCTKLVLFQDLKRSIVFKQLPMPFIKVGNQVLTFRLTIEATMATLRCIKMFTGEDGDEMMDRKGILSEVNLDEEVDNNEVKLDEEVDNNEVKLDEEVDNNEVKLDEEVDNNEVKLDEEVDNNEVKLDEEVDNNEVKLDEEMDNNEVNSSENLNCFTINFQNTKYLGYEDAPCQQNYYDLEKEEIALQCVDRNVYIHKILGDGGDYHDAVGELLKGCTINFNQMKEDNYIYDWGISVQL